MMGKDSFFVSEGLEHIFQETTQASVVVNGVEGQFISYTSVGRTTQFEVQRVDPFEVIDGKDGKLSLLINIPGSDTRELLYTKWSYKINQGKFGFIITVGETDE